MWPGRDKRRRRQTKPVPSRCSPATTWGSSDCHPMARTKRDHSARDGHAASCPRLCPREGAHGNHTGVCTGCRCLPPALHCAADVGLWLTPGQALKALGAGKRSALPPRCHRLSLTGLEHPQVPTAPSNKGGQSPSPPCPLGAVPRGSRRAAAGDLGLLPQGGGHQDPRSHFLDRGASECFQQSNRYISFYKAFLFGKFQTKKNIGYNELPGTHHPASAVINSDQVSLSPGVAMPWCVGTLTV